MKRSVLFLFAAAVLCTANYAQAGKYNEALNIGDTPAAFSKLPGTDGKDHSLSDYKKAKAVAVVFTCNHCPVAVAYEDRLVALQNKYSNQGVQLIAINVNPGEADSLPNMKKRAEEKQFSFPYLFDASQKSAKDYGATVTPHVFLLDAERKVVYMGAIDDSMNTSKIKEHHLQNAIDAVLAGKAPSVAETRQFGCGVKYSK